MMSGNDRLKARNIPCFFEDKIDGKQIKSKSDWRAAERLEDTVGFMEPQTKQHKKEKPRTRLEREGEGGKDANRCRK